MKLLDLVSLRRDIPEYHLRAGDVGTVVELLSGEAVIVEFVEASGDTRAVTTLSVNDLREVGPHEMLATRSKRPVRTRAAQGR